MYNTGSTLLLIQTSYYLSVSALQREWRYYTPEVLFILIFILAFVLWFAVGIMLLWHLWGIIQGETSPEAQDHEIYRKVAKERGEVCLLFLLTPV
jgi:hypothetical protein